MSPMYQCTMVTYHPIIVPNKSGEQFILVYKFTKDLYIGNPSLLRVIQKSQKKVHFLCLFIFLAFFTQINNLLRMRSIFSMLFPHFQIWRNKIMEK